VAIKFTAIIVLIWLIYFQDFVLALAQSETTSYILVLPFLIVYLVYRKRKMLRATIPYERSVSQTKIVKINEIVGALLSLLAFLLYWQGSFTQHSLQYHIATLPLFAAGLILILFNAQTLKVLALPMTFLLFLIPPPLEVVNSTGKTLATFTSTAVFNGLRALGLHLTLTTQHGFPVLILEKSVALTMTLVVDVATVGTYFLIVFTVFWAMVTFTVRGVAWKKAIMFLAWFPCILVLNIMRITIMILMNYRFGIDVLNDVSYNVGGWFFILTGAFLLLFYTSKKILKIQIYATGSTLSLCSSCNQSLGKKQNFCPSCGKLEQYVVIRVSRRDMLKIGALIAIVSLSTFLEVPAFALRDDKIQVVTYLPREGRRDTPILPEISGYTLGFDYSEKELEKLVGSNASLTFVYTPIDGLTPTIYGTMSTNASKDIPLRGEVLSSSDAQVLQNPLIMGRLVSLHKHDSNLTSAILYWFERTVFDAEPTLVRKHLMISIFTFSNSSANYTTLEEDLIPVGQAIAGYLEPIRVLSDISSLFPEYLTALTVLVIGLLIGIATIQIMDSRKEKKLNMEAFNKLTVNDDKNVLRAIHQAEKVGISRANAIAVSFQGLVGKPIEQNRLLDTLRHAEELGLVKSTIVNENDEPVLVWKTQIAFPNSKLHLQRIRNPSDQVAF